MSRLTLATLCCLILFAATHAQTRPPRNYEDVGACPFECCVYREWSVVADTTLYKNRSNNAPVGFKVKKGERVTGLTGVVVTLAPGKAVATGDMTVGEGSNRKVRVRRGDVLYLLHSVGEGSYKIWFRGRLYEEQPQTAEEHATLPQSVVRLPYLRMLRAPRTVWWVKVRNKRGQTGWSTQDDHFGDMDACG